MHVEFLIGPAGSGKTTRCLAGIRSALSLRGNAPLLLLAPKQATFQLERQILETGSIEGYARLQILSFERLAGLLLENLDGAAPSLIEEEGRAMILRALLMDLEPDLGIFHATARLPGFARHVAAVLRECQRSRITASRLREIAGRLSGSGSLPLKLNDLALLLDAYLQWLKDRGLQDATCLLDLAAERLRSQGSPAPAAFRVEHLWLDGFAEMTPQEVDLLTALIPACHRATLAFCLDHRPPDEPSWLSTWSVVGQTFLRCWNRISALPGCRPTLESLARHGAGGRFRGAPALAHLESEWSRPAPAVPPPEACPDPHIRLVLCADPEAEAMLVAREILRWVRQGGRFRDAGVVVRSLDSYQAPLRRVFTRYGIPFFMDRREPVGHHPLAEFTRSALRLAGLQWSHEDLFSLLKTGLAGLDAGAVDWLEQTALAQGWSGEDWTVSLPSRGREGDASHADSLRGRFVPPLARLARSLKSASGPGPSGADICQGLRTLWSDFDAEGQLRAWAADGEVEWRRSSSVHLTVWEQMLKWVENLELALSDRAMPLREWLPILEAGLGSLTVGVIPPAIDQVMVGSIDRSRNPELKWVAVLGLNEGLFPAPPAPPRILTERERDRLVLEDAPLGLGQRRMIGHERYLGYIALTRASDRLLVTWAAADVRGTPLQPSPFIAQIQRMFPGIATARFDGDVPWAEAEHPSEIAPALLARWSNTDAAASPRPGAPPASVAAALADHGAFAGLARRHRSLLRNLSAEEVPGSIPEALFGTTLRSSVSALEDYAACPFRFFAARGLGAETREVYEPDARERGSLQHELLKAFQDRLQADALLWRDLSPERAADLIGEIGMALLPVYRGGLFHSTPVARFHGERLVGRVQSMAGALVTWMGQYRLDPSEVEVGFGFEDSRYPGLHIDLPDGKALQLRGRVDRLDRLDLPGSQDTLVVIIDYKSSPRTLDRVKLAHGLQLQLTAYLTTLTQDGIESRRRIPAGMFYICLNPTSGTTASRPAATPGVDVVPPAGFQHRGLFNRDYIEWLDRRGVVKGDQFKYAQKRDGTWSARPGDAMAPGDFRAVLEDSIAHMARFGEEIFAGRVAVSPYQLEGERACDYCDLRAICRFDPWVDPFRVLQDPGGTL